MEILFVCHEPLRDSLWVISPRKVSRFVTHHGTDKGTSFYWVMGPSGVTDIQTDTQTHTQTDRFTFIILTRSPKILRAIYAALIRPYLEYAFQIWNLPGPEQ